MPSFSLRPGHNTDDLTEIGGSAVIGFGMNMPESADQGFHKDLLLLSRLLFRLLFDPSCKEETDGEGDQCNRKNEEQR